MPRKPHVSKHIPEDELERMYRLETNSRLKERLLAIILLYDGMNIYEVSAILRRCDRTIKEWLSRWNKNGYLGLVPGKGGGRKWKMPYDMWDDILEEIEGKGMTIGDVVDYVKTTRGVKYSYKRVWTILRKKKKVRYGKPYIQNQKRPENAELDLKKD